MKILLIILLIDNLGNETLIKHSEHESFFKCNVAKANLLVTEKRTPSIKYVCVNEHVFKNRINNTASN